MILIPLSPTFLVKAERIVQVTQDLIHNKKVYFVEYRNDEGNINQYRVPHTDLLKLCFKENRIKIINETD
mgnify:FL=1